MKVNISGVGLIPKVGLLAPVYGRDLTKDTVAVILNYASFKVYVAATGIRITKKNINEIFGEAVKQAVVAPTPAAPTPKKKPTKKSAPKVVEAPVEIEQVEEPVEFNEVVEAPAIEDAVLVGVDLAQNEDVIIEADSTSEDVIVDEDSTAEENEEKPTYTSKKKKRR